MIERSAAWRLVKSTNLNFLGLEEPMENIGKMKHKPGSFIDFNTFPELQIEPEEDISQISFRGSKNKVFS